MKTQKMAKDVRIGDTISIKKIRGFIVGNIHHFEEGIIRLMNKDGNEMFIFGENDFVNVINGKERK